MHRNKERKSYKPTEQDIISTPVSPNPYKQMVERQESSRSKAYTSKNTFLQYKKSPENQREKDSNKDNDKMEALLKENAELRRQIIQLKVHQFYHFDDNKLKELIIEVEDLRKHLKKCQVDLDQAMVENDFLRRTNIQLKNQLESYVHARQKEKELSSSNHHDVSHRTLKMTNKNEEVTNSSSFQMQNTTLDEVLNDYRQNTHLQESKSTTKKNLNINSIIDKCISPRRKKNQEERSSSPNQYLLYKRQKAENRAIFEKLE